MEKLVKTVCMAKSGIYEYSKDDVFTKFNLDKEELSKIKHKDMYNIYRPAEVLINNKELYTKLPLLYTGDTGHPDNFEDQSNWDKYSVGMTGDTVEAKFNDKQEAELISTVTIVREDGIQAYNYGIIEVSPGYYGKFVYAPGETPKKEQYDIIMTEVDKVDHLLITSSGRGGNECKILDSKGGKTMPEFLKTMLIGIAKGFKIDLEFKAIPTQVGDDSKAKDDDSKAKDDNYDDSKTKDDDSKAKAKDDNYDDSKAKAKDDDEEEKEKKEEAKADDSATTINETEMKGKEPSVKDDDTMDDDAKTKDAMEQGKEEDIENNLLLAWENLHKLMGEWKDSKGKAKDTVPSAIKSTEIKANNLENNESGPDKVLHLGKGTQEKVVNFGTGDSAVSPLLNSSDSSVKKEDIVELFKKF